MWAHFSVSGLSHPSSPDSVGSRRLQRRDERDVGWAGSHRGSPAKKPPTALEGQDCPMAAHVHVHHLLLQPAVGHVCGVDGKTPRHANVSIPPMMICQNQTDSCLLPRSLPSLLTSSWRQVYRETRSAMSHLVLEYVKSSPQSPAWVTPSAHSSYCNLLYIQQTHSGVLQLPVVTPLSFIL